MAALATAGGIAKALTAFGTIIGAAGTLRAGAATQATANYQAAQLEQGAKEERAAAQREQFEQRKKTNLLLSRQQHVAASSGLGALDPTVLELAGDVEQEGGYREGLIKYAGENRARGLTDQAKGLKASGKAARIGSFFNAAGTVASGFGSMFGKYGQGMPGSDDFDLGFDDGLSNRRYRWG